MYAHHTQKLGELRLIFPFPVSSYCKDRHSGTWNQVSYKTEVKVARRQDQGGRVTYNFQISDFPVDVTKLYFENTTLACFECVLAIVSYIILTQQNRMVPEFQCPNFQGTYLQCIPEAALKQQQLQIHRVTTQWHREILRLWRQSKSLRTFCGAPQMPWAQAVPL